MKQPGSQFEQLPLFMTATEWKDSMTRSSDRRYTRTRAGEAPAMESMDEMWARKLHESKQPTTMMARGWDGTEVEVDTMVHGAGVYKSIEETGFNPEPGKGPGFFIDKKTGERQQANGHHRIAAMADMEKNKGRTFYIPTNAAHANLPRNVATGENPPS